jgi:hypothetical protein
VKHRPKRLPPGYLAWCIPVWTYPEDELIQTAGLDAAVFIRVLRFGASGPPAHVLRVHDGFINAGGS